MSDAAGWVTAGAALLAVGVGGRALLEEIRSGRDRDREAALRAADRRMAQAREVVLWPSDPVVDDPNRAPNNRTYTSITIHNRSSEPVLNVFLAWVDIPTSHSTQLHDWPVLAPGERQVIVLPDDDLKFRPGDPADRYRLAFTDARGVRWWRTSDGALRQPTIDPG